MVRKNLCKIFFHVLSASIILVFMNIRKTIKLSIIYEPVCGRYIDHNRKENSWRLREVISGGANLNNNQARDNFDPR